MILIRRQVKKMYGYFGKMLVVDLSKGSFEIQEIGKEILHKFIGGKGLGVKLLYDLLPPKVDPLSEENIVLLVTGPLVNTQVPTSCRFGLITKSPLTGAFLDSYASENLGPAMKACGLDVVLIKGKSERPVTLVLNDNQVLIKSAEVLWGKGCLETEKVLAERYPGSTSACIGPAGENMVLYASVYTEGRFAGRGGGGAVLGSKGLKAIVVKGSQQVPLKDPELFKSNVKKCRDLLREHPLTNSSGPLRKMGTPNIISTLNYFGVLPTRNWQTNTFEQVEGITGEAMYERVIKAVTPCVGCPIGCGKTSEVREGKYQGSWTRGPELETVYSLGSQVGVGSIEAVVHANQLCNDLGMDTISAGVCIGYAMELFEKGYLTLEDTGGIDLKFGNDEALMEVIEKIAYREGIGEFLAIGTKKMALALGRDTESFAMQSKGLELPAYDPRGMKGMGIAYATSDRGGCHLRASTLNMEVRGLIKKDVDRFSEEGKAEFVKGVQDAWSVIDCMIYCKFAGYAISLDNIKDLYSAATGLEVATEDLLLAGERVFNLTRLFNLREGLTRKDDTLPKRLITEGVTEGPSAGQRVDLEKMLEEYYPIRCWNNEGIPTQEKIQELGLLQEYEELLKRKGN